MKEVTIRFLEVYEYLVSIKLVENAADFCRKIGISNSMFTEISKGRTNVGLQAIQKTVSTYDFINTTFILTGKGELDLRNEITYTPNLNDNLDSPTSPSNTHSDTPTYRKIDTPTDTPTTNLGLPKVITVNDNNEDLIPFVGTKAAAGYLNGYADPEYIESLPTIRMPGFRDGTYRAFENRGHSMLPTLHTSSISVGRWVEQFEDIRDRRIYIVVSKSEGIVVKRVLNRISDSGKLILLSDNLNKIDYPNIVLDASEVKEVWYLRGAFIFDFPEPGEMYSRVNDLEARLTLMEHSFQKLLK